MAFVLYSYTPLILTEWAHACLDYTGLDLWRIIKLEYDSIVYNNPLGNTRDKET